MLAYQVKSYHSIVSHHKHKQEKAPAISTVVTKVHIST